MRDRDLPHQRAHLLPARPRQREPSQRPPDEGQLDEQPEHPERRREVAGHAERRADQYEPPDPLRRAEREDGRHEPPERAADEVDAVEPEPVQNVAEERGRERGEIRRLVVERVREAVAGQVDGEDAMVLGERCQDRRPESGVVEGAVDEHERRPVPEREHPGLALRPPQAPRARSRREPLEHGSVRRLDPPVELACAGRCLPGGHRAASAGAEPNAFRLSMTTDSVFMSPSVGLNSTISAPAWWTGVCPGGT